MNQSSDSSGVSKRLSAVVLGVIMLAAAVLRLGTFYLPHAGGDQLLYTALALKLKTTGMKSYNLRGVNILSEPSGTVWALQIAPAEAKGDILRLLEGGNVHYYSRETLSNMPPLYSHLLMASHSLFGNDDKFPLVRSNLGWEFLRVRPFFLLEVQFYATCLNFAFALVLIGLTYRLATLVYDRSIALVAAAFVALNPVDLLTSQRIWADEVLACLFALSAILLLRGLQLRSLRLLAASGVACGLAITTKGSGLYLLLINSAFIVMAALVFFRETTMREKLLFIVKAGAAFALGALPFAVAWHGLVYLHYGTPIYIAYQEGIADVSEWFRELSLRNRWGQFYYFVILFPAFAFFYTESACQVVQRALSLERLYLILLPVACILLLIYSNGREERYLLPAYPMIAAVAAAGLLRLARFIPAGSLPHWQKVVASALAMSLVATSCVYAAYNGLSVVVSGLSIFPVR